MDLLTIRSSIEETFGDRVETTYVESVPEGPDAARTMISNGVDMIFTTSFGYTVKVAKENRHFFEHTHGI